MKGRLTIAALAVVGVTFACRGTLLTHFDHRAHLAERSCGGPGQQPCLNCTSCHLGPVSAEHDHFAAPQAGACVECHQDSEAKLKHSIRPALAQVPAGKKIIFSHAKHLTMSELKGQCVKCHGGAVGFQNGPPLFPPMTTCLNCHEHRDQFDKGECLGCHEMSDLRELKPASFLPHDNAWFRRHGAAARGNEAQCEMCHAQTKCDSCHDSSKRLGPAQVAPEMIDRTFAHRFDYISRHAMESRSQPGSCFTCHVRSECNACHASRGVSPSVEGAQNPHPPGWASGLVSNTHGPAARRDIASCAACHDQGAASNCVRCHKVGGIGGTPHPPGWRSTASGSTREAACAPCHGGAL